tara:strand:+ start:296 stop:1369 length:1074 start_codon:yes stop_codon:yes gene_type:complete
MKLFVLFLSLSLTLIGQTTSYVTNLSNDIIETSGLIYLNNRLITHNDSGGEAALFEINPLTGLVTRKIVIENASNIDWEDICYDDDYIYIGDFGNNYGNRTDLKIYKIEQEEYFNNDTIQSELLSFKYRDQTDFTSQQFTTSYDAEALISINDSLYLFSKNWENFRSTIYALGKDTGDQEISAKDTLASNGLITGAEFNDDTNTIVLTGYGLFSAFVLELKEFHSGLFSNGSSTNYSLEVSSSRQIEGICHLNEYDYLVSAESSSSGNATLYNLSFNPFLINQTKTQTKIYPNPSNTIVTIDTPKDAVFDLYSETGKLILKKCKNPLDVSELPKGIYLLKLEQNKVSLGDTYKILVE